MRILTGTRPTGKLHIGNYISSIKPMLELQRKHEMFFMIADLHAQTTPYSPKELKESTFDLAASLVALGVDLKKTLLFVQSQVPQHTQLSWILSTIMPLGELYRMTQFKDKSQKIGKESTNAGLLTYPILQAADILLYQAEAVPVGKDQEQHLELTRTIARRFNQKFGEAFKIPKTIRFEAEKVLSLASPKRKMSKTEPQGSIGIFDSPKEIFEKFKKAITDSGKEIKYEPKQKPAIANLLLIFSAVGKKPIERLEKEFQNKGYGEFKKALAETFIKYFAQAKKRKEALLKNPTKISKLLTANALKAQKIAQKTLDLVYKKTGLK